MKNAFVGPDSVLKAWGYVESNEPTDTKIPVPEDFNLELGKWRYQAGQWVSVI